ncbi:MAG TPA: DUF3566 domain-containing protein [Acidimicrobiia bacterium]|nr:DUF3566 domain-containing protein [Acidimicrobiia bacterium]
MTSPPEDVPAPTSTTAPKPPRRKRSGDTANLSSAPKTDDAPNSDGAPKTDETVASTSDAPAPPKRGRRNAGAAASAVTAAASSAAGSTTAAPVPAKAAPKKVTPAPAVRSSPPVPDSPSVAPVPAVAKSAVDADAVLVDDTPAPAKRARDAGKTTVSSVPAPAPTVVGTGATSAVRSERTFRQTITKVDLWSITKLALCFYLSSMFVTVVALVALWLIASAAGIVHSVEKFLGDLLSAKNFHFLSATVLRGAILVGLVVVALQVVITVIGASFYNIFAELFGGVEITVREDGPGE